MNERLVSTFRLDELPPVRPVREEDLNYSSTKPRGNTPDFMPNFQSAQRKQPVNESRPRRMLAQKSRTADGQVYVLLFF